MGQGTLGFPQRQYYENETAITAAYRQFIRDLAKQLSNDTSLIDQDVEEIYAFEKNIAQVRISSISYALKILGLVLLDK